MKNKTLIGVVIFAMFVVAIFFAIKNTSTLLSIIGGEREIIGVGNNTLLVSIADEEAEREKGLSGRISLAKNEGMLFVYNAPVVPVFWMKDMNFPIDIIWISKGQVVGWISDVDPQKDVPEKSLDRYSPAGFIDSALEVPSGTGTRLDISMGDVVSFKKAR